MEYSKEPGLCPECGAWQPDMQAMLVHITLDHFIERGQANKAFTLCWCGFPLSGLGLASHILGSSEGRHKITPEDIQMHYLDAMMGVRS